MFSQTRRWPWRSAPPNWGRWRLWRGGARQPGWGHVGWDCSEHLPSLARLPCWRNSGHAEAAGAALTADRNENFGAWVALLQERDAGFHHRRIRAAAPEGGSRSSPAAPEQRRLPPAVARHTLASAPVRSHRPPGPVPAAAAHAHAPALPRVPEAEAGALKRHAAAVAGIRQHEGEAHDVDVAGQRRQLGIGSAARPRVAPGLPRGAG